MAAAKCATAAGARAAGIPGTATGGASGAKTARRVVVPTWETRQITSKAATFGQAVKPYSRLNVAGELSAWSNSASPPGTVRGSAVVETVPRFLRRAREGLSSGHLLRSTPSYSSEVVCALGARQLSSYAHFAQQLRSQYNRTLSVSGSISTAAAKDSQTSTSSGAEGRVTTRSSTSSVQQREGHSGVNGQQVLVSSTSTVPGYTIISYKGFVHGCSVQARDMLLMAKVFLLVQLGGEVEDMTSLIQRAKTEAIERVCREAATLGANAVVGVRLVSSGTHQRTAVEFSAYGTAVLVKKAF